MEELTNISSQEELLQLRNEGRISEEEYKELFVAMRKSLVSDAERLLQKEAKSKKKRRMGIGAFVWMLGGIIFPIGFAVASNSLIEPTFLCFAFIWEVSAFVLAIFAWPDTFGKTTMIASACIFVAASLFTIFHHIIVEFAPQLTSAGERKHLVAPVEVTELERFPLDNMEGLLTQTGIQIDRQVTSDGNGSLRSEATRPTTFRLFETGDIDIENARLIYQAKVRTEDIEGQVYLEMWCHFPGKGEFFSRGLMTPLTGTTDWTKEETTFFLKNGDNPDNAKLNLVFTGKGTAWIDDIRLLKGAL